jgi:hypothetical protein
MTKGPRIARMAGLDLLWTLGKGLLILCAMGAAAGLCAALADWWLDRH